MERRLGPDNPDAAKAQVDLAVIYARLNRYEEAKPIFLKALAVLEKAWGTDSPKLIRPLDDWTGNLWTMGKATEASPFEERANKLRAARTTPAK
jgi:tetratricopeptide (TPR) repeat protein